MVVPTPLRRTSRDAVRTRNGRPRSSTGPSGRNSSVSTPHGTTEMACSGTPSALSSNASSEHVAITWSTLRPTAGSIHSRSAGLVSAEPWCRRLTTPSAWKVCTTGIRTPPVRAWTCWTASSAACPDIQKCPCTTSGRSTNHSAAITEANVPMNGNNSSFGT